MVSTSTPASRRTQAPLSPTGNGGHALAAAAKAFKLQFEKRRDAGLDPGSGWCCCADMSTEGAWRPRSPCIIAFLGRMLGAESAQQGRSNPRDALRWRAVQVRIL